MRHDGAGGMARLNEEIQRIIRKAIRPSYTHDLGEITPGMGLVLDRFGQEIPEGDYLVDESFGQRTGIEAAHSHEVRRPLAPGDRVKVDIIDGDQDEWTAYIIGRTGA